VRALWRWWWWWAVVVVVVVVVIMMMIMIIMLMMMIIIIMMVVVIMMTVMSMFASCSCRCISDIKFSPDGLVLAMGSHDTTLYFYNVADFGCKAKCRGHKVRSAAWWWWWW
jgi:hypothetical protein